MDILLSYDEGNTFPVTLAAGTPNDGSENIIVPAGLTTQGRIMVRGSNHIFYDINNANITIQSGSPGFDLTVNPTTESFCIGASKQITLSTESILGYSVPINLSISGLPAGMSASFSVNPVNPGSLSILTITNNSASPGSFNGTITGVSGSLNNSKSITIQVPAALGGTPNLTSPIDNSSEVDVKPLFTWSAVANASSYDLQVSGNSNFNTFEIDINVSSNNFQVIIPLNGLTTHYWRVRAKNACGQSEWSPVRTFETQPCFTYQATDLPINISASGTPTINSYLNIPDRGTITDLDVLNLTGLHTYMSDLRFTLFAPNSTSRIIWDRPCSDQDNFNINFDQSAPPGSWPCPPTNGGTYQPSNSLNIFNGVPQKGQWRLQVQDLANLDGGSLQSWSLKTCLTDYCKLTVDNENATGVGSLAFAINCAASGDTIRFAPGFINKTIDLGNNFLEINKSMVIEANPTANIHVISTSANPTITNTQQSKIIGLYIHAPSVNAPAILNGRILELENVHLIKYPGGNTTLLNTGILDVKGYCNIVD